MRLLNRLGRLLRKNEPLRSERSALDVAPGDMMEVGLVVYEVVGTVRYRNRRSLVATLRDGTRIRYLEIEERETTAFVLFDPIDGRLDTPEEIPTTIEMEGRSYYLEERFSGFVDVAGRTPFSAGGEQYVWLFQSDDRRRLRIEWQDGRIMLYEGESVLPAEVRLIRGAR